MPTNDSVSFTILAATCISLSIETYMYVAATNTTAKVYSINVKSICEHIIIILRGFTARYILVPRAQAVIDMVIETETLP